MGNLPEIIKNVAVAVHNPPPGTKAIDLRRQMVELPQVAEGLNKVERYVFAASTKTQICDIDDKTLVEKMAQMFRFIAMDVGYIIPTENPDDWKYICTRLLDLIKRYYSQLTLAEVKLAFELATTGELNDYLPPGRGGEPDKNHYQQFNVDYFAKILNAYRKKQNNVISKAFKTLPEPNRDLTPEQKQEYSNENKKKTIWVFLFYKYRGNLPDLSMIEQMLIYNQLADVGLAEPINITDEDKIAALNGLKVRIAKGFINEFAAFQIRKQGVEHEDVQPGAFWIARRKALETTFAEMVAEEIQIVEFIKVTE